MLRDAGAGKGLQYRAWTNWDHWSYGLGFMVLAAAM